MQRTWFVSLASLVLAVVIGVAYLRISMPSGWEGGQDVAGATLAELAPAAGDARMVTAGSATIGGPFSLTDQHGRQVTDATLKGKYALVLFGYTSCPDVCPTALSTVTMAMEKLGKRANRLTPVFITVDPARDTPKKMADYASNFDSRLLALTGSEGEIRAAAAAYKVYYEIHAPKPGKADYAVDHSAYLYLMDPDGNYLTHFPYDVSPETLYEALTRNLKPD